MQPSASHSYLETEILTATPQKRQLLLIDGAIRFIERARHHLHADDDEEFCECLIRAQRIVTELMAALDHEVAPKLTGKVASLYVFVFRALVDAGLTRDEAKLDDAVRVLQPQREAWEGVCRELGAAAPLENEAAAASLSDRGTPPKPHAGLDLSADSDGPDEAPAGFSLEA